MLYCNVCKSNNVYETNNKQITRNGVLFYLKTGLLLNAFDADMTNINY